MRLVVPEGLKKGKLIAYEGDRKKDKDVPDQLTVEVQGPKTKQLVNLSVEKGNPNAFKQISMAVSYTHLKCLLRSFFFIFDFKLCYKVKKGESQILGLLLFLLNEVYLIFFN